MLRPLAPPDGFDSRSQVRVRCMDKVFAHGVGMDARRIGIDVANVVQTVTRRKMLTWGSDTQQTRGGAHHDFARGQTAESKLPAPQTRHGRHSMQMLRGRWAKVLEWRHRPRRGARFVFARNNRIFQHITGNSASYPVVNSFYSPFNTACTWSAWRPWNIFVLDPWACWFPGRSVRRAA